MAFSQATIQEVYSPVQNGGRLYLRWRSSSPQGTWFQAYVNRRLAWWGTERRAEFPLSPGTRQRIDIGTVAATEVQTDFSSTLPAAPETRAQLSWQGGTYQDNSNLIQGFRIYGEPSPGAGIDYDTPLAFVPAYEDGIPHDGWGAGGFGSGGFGFAGSDYSWTSNELTDGTWEFGVKTVDAAGNEGLADTTTVTIVAPPLPPALNASGRRLTYTYDDSTQEVTLSWLASP